MATVSRNAPRCSVCRKTGHNCRTCPDRVSPPSPSTEDDDCPICMEPLGKTNCCTTECGHKFCLRCMLKHAQTKSNCPLCRADIDGADKPVSSPMPPSLPQTVLEGWGRVRLNEERELIAARNRSREHADQLRRLALQASTPPGSINPHPSNPYYAGSQARLNPATGRFNITLYNHFNLPVDVWWNPADPVRPPRRLHVNIAPNTYRIIHVGGRGDHFFVIPWQNATTPSTLAQIGSPASHAEFHAQPHHPIIVLDENLTLSPPAPAQPASGYDSDEDLYETLPTEPPVEYP